MHELANKQRAVAGLDQALLVVVVDHRVDEHDLVALLVGDGGDLEELERCQVGCHAHALGRIGPVRHEQNETALALLDHRRRVRVR